MNVFGIIWNHSVEGHVRPTTVPFKTMSHHKKLFFKLMIECQETQCQVHTHDSTYHMNPAGTIFS